MASSPPAPTIVAGRYRPTAVLGRGGMATVWEATDERLGRPVALKLTVGLDADSAARCRAEGRVLAALQHPHVVGVLDAGEHEGSPFVVTELVRGRSLREEMAAGPLAPSRAARVGAEVASALDAAHRLGIVHRDLTPANVLLAE